MNKRKYVAGLLLALSGCVGGGGGGDSGGSPKKVALPGDWNQVFTLTDCGTVEFHRMSTFFSDSGDTTKIGTMRDQGEFPTVRGGGVCDMTTHSQDYNFSPYPSSQDSAQFDEMFSLKTGWSYRDLRVTEFSANRITLVREFDDGRIWTYVFTR